MSFSILARFPGGACSQGSVPSRTVKGGSESSMNRTVLLRVAALVAIDTAVVLGAANASATNLLCKESKGRQEQEIISSGGASGTRTSREVKDLGKSWDIPVSIDTGTGAEMVWESLANSS